MNLFRNPLYPALVSLAIAAELTVDGAWYGAAPLRWCLLGSAVALSIASCAVIALCQKRSQAHICRNLALMAESADATYAQSVAAAAAAACEPRSPWRSTFEGLQRLLGSLAERNQQLEQTRAALEIRFRRMRQQGERASAILSALPEPVLAVDDYDELVVANPSAQRLLNVTVGGAEQRALGQLVRCERLVEMLNETRRRTGPCQRTGEVQIPDADGESHWYSVTTRKLSADPDDPNSQGAMAVLRDISLQKASQRRNAEFVSAVSHEMKTPLAGIKAYVELLVDGDAEDDEAREQFVNVIGSQADRLQRLVDNLLNLARIEAGVVAVSKHSRSLNEVLDEALRLIVPSAEAKNIALQKELSPLYLGVLADRDMLLQAAINLLSNAVKYTPAGGRVTLRSRLDDEHVRFEVADTGVGLSREDCTKVFEKFYRVHSNKDMAAGTGLGLPLAKHIVEDVHGGKLFLESVLGEGSTFSVVLPSAGSLA